MISPEYSIYKCYVTTVAVFNSTRRMVMVHDCAVGIRFYKMLHTATGEAPPLPFLIIPFCIHTHCIETNHSTPTFVSFRRLAIKDSHTDE